MCTVVNKYKEDYDVYIGRGSKWGNPYTLNPDKSGFETISCTGLEVCIDQYGDHLWEMIKDGRVTIDELIALDGKRLGCFCKPKPCHGDVIVRAVNWAVKKYGTQSTD